jgi:hypothetical protein
MLEKGSSTADYCSEGELPPRSSKDLDTWASAKAEQAMALTWLVLPGPRIRINRPDDEYAR